MKRKYPLQRAHWSPLTCNLNKDENCSRKQVEQISSDVSHQMNYSFRRSCFSSCKGLRVRSLLRRSLNHDTLKSNRRLWRTKLTIFLLSVSLRQMLLRKERTRDLEHHWLGAEIITIFLLGNSSQARKKRGTQLTEKDETEMHHTRALSRLTRQSRMYFARNVRLGHKFLSSKRWHRIWDRSCVENTVCHCSAESIG